MLVELSRKDLISLVRGREPSYEQMDHPLCEANGRFNASYGTWNWAYDSLTDCTEQELWDFYCYLKTPVIIPPNYCTPNSLINSLMTVHGVEQVTVEETPQRLVHVNVIGGQLSDVQKVLNEMIPINVEVNLNHTA